MSAREFSEAREYTATTLYWWSSKLKRGATPEPKQRVRLARVVRKPDARSGPRTAPIVVQVGPARVEVGADANADVLSVVLEALASTGWGARS